MGIADLVVNIELFIVNQDFFFLFFPLFSSIK